MDLAYDCSVYQKSGKMRSMRRQEYLKKRKRKVNDIRNWQETYHGKKTGGDINGNIGF